MVCKVIVVVVLVVGIIVKFKKKKNGDIEEIVLDINILIGGEGIFKDLEN